MFVNGSLTRSWIYVRLGLRLCSQQIFKNRMNMNLRHVTLAAIALLCLAVPFETTAQTKEHQVASSQTKRTTHRRKHRAKKRRVKKHRARHKKLAAPAVPQAATTTPSGLTYVITQHGAGRQ